MSAISRLNCSLCRTRPLSLAPSGGCRSDRRQFLGVAFPALSFFLLGITWLAVQLFLLCMLILVGFLLLVYGFSSRGVFLALSCFFPLGLFPCATRGGCFVVCLSSLCLELYLWLDTPFAGSCHRAMYFASLIGWVHFLRLPHFAWVILPSWMWFPLVRVVFALAICSAGILWHFSSGMPFGLYFLASPFFFAGSSDDPIPSLCSTVSPCVLLDAPLLFL